MALADLPGIEEAEVFEPAPEEIYTWPDAWIRRPKLSTRSS